MTNIGSIIEGKYKILTVIGKGGMSIVYLAMDTRLNKQWAVKEIRKRGNGKNDEIVVNSLLAEAQLMKKLDHPSLPRIVDIIDNEETIYIVMDYIEGESLDKKLEIEGPQDEELVIEWAKQLCDALSYLHSQKPPIIYRDMKPANVMLKPEGNIKIIDFGIAREYKEEKLSDTTVLGTKGYAPPEQYSGQTDPRSDIYALGMTMHHLLTGVDPRKSVAYAPVRMYNPKLSEGIEIIIDKCVQPASENRYQNCTDLLYDLEHPELITKGYKKKQKRKLSSFITAISLAIVFALTSLISNVLATRENNNNYEILISSSAATSLEDKVKAYKKAIDIYPNKIDAYLKILEAYEDDGKFGKEENDEFLALYNAHKDTFDITSKEYAELNYKIGMMYFNYYREEDGSFSFSNRVQKAFSFFELNYENEQISPDFEYKLLSDCYYRISYFYKKYILSTVTVEEASKENYDELLSTIEITLNDVENQGAYDQLSLYNGVFMLLYDQRNSMAQANVDKDEVIDLLDKVYKKTNNLSVKKDQSKNLQEEILDNYEEYKESIDRAYINEENRELLDDKKGND